MLKMKLKKQSIRKKRLKQWLESTQVNLLNSQFRSWDRDKFIEEIKKIQNPTSNIFNVEGWNRKKNVNPWDII
jgi:hypothetical protein